MHTIRVILPVSHTGNYSELLTVASYEPARQSFSRFILILSYEPDYIYTFYHLWQSGVWRYGMLFQTFLSYITVQLVVTLQFPKARDYSTRRLSLREAPPLADAFKKHFLFSTSSNTLQSVTRSGMSHLHHAVQRVHQLLTRPFLVQVTHFCSYAPTSARLCSGVANKEKFKVLF